MKIINKIKQKATDNMNQPPVTSAFLGDSVTQGCFEVYVKKDGNVETIFDKECAYHHYLAKILALLYPTVPVNIINAGISGDNAPHGLKRLQTDVLSHNPDMTVVCFGLNDSAAGKENIGKYTAALRDIFKTIQEHNLEVIFMTPNMMNIGVSDHVTDERIKAIARNTMKTQLDGTLDLYVEEAKKVCEASQVKVCDCYEKWKTLYRNGVDITELLANKINHPLREMNWLSAISLVETMMEEE